MSGTIPTELGLLTLVTYFHLGVNNLHATVPTELGMLTAATAYVLAMNNLEGPIPSEFGLLTNIQSYFDIFDNNVTGIIPESLCAAPSNIGIDCDDVVCPSSCECDCHCEAGHVNCS